VSSDHLACNSETVAMPARRKYHYGIVSNRFSILGFRMSLIWDQLHNSDIASLPTSVPAELVPTGRRVIEQRKSGRVDIYVPLFVYGYTSGEEPFHEETHTLDVSTCGGLLQLDVPVRSGQKLLLLNRVSKQEIECTVVRLVKQAKRTYVGVDFGLSAPGFWKCSK
jgi:hypothetical protein